MPFTCLLVVYFGPFSLSFFGSVMWPFTSYNKTKTDSVTNISKFIQKFLQESEVIRKHTYLKAAKNLPESGRLCFG